MLRPPLDPARFGVKPSRLRLVAVVMTCACAVLGFWTPALWIVALIAGVVVAAMPGAHTLALRELDRRLLLFRHEVSSCDTEDPAKIEALKLRGVALGLNEREAAIELDLLNGASAVTQLKKCAAQIGLPTVVDFSSVISGQTCHFVADAVLEKRGTPHDTGRLFLTTQKLVFQGCLSLTTVDWKDVSFVKEQKYQVLIQRIDRKTPWTFTFASLEQAMSAAFVAEWLAHHKFAEQFQ